MILARMAKDWGKPQVRRQNPKRIAGRWRMAIERIVIWHTVDVQLQALGAETSCLAIRRRITKATDTRPWGGGNGD